jgi:type I restriction enzyme M protein
MPKRPPGRSGRTASPSKAPKARAASATTANLGFEAKLWAAADALRNNMDAAEYKHVVLGLIFLKYISDAFEAKHAELQAQKKQGADPEDRDEYRAASVFWVPKEARWQSIKANAPQPTIGTLLDDAMAAIERDNPSLKGVLPKDYARPGLDKQRLAQIINLVSDIALGSPADRARDTLGRVYEYFLARFASAEGKSGGQFYTPTHVVRVLVEMLAPYKGRVYDPCCGSGGMFVQSEKFIEAHAGRVGDISIYGQESNYTTWRLAKMNLAIRGIDAQITHGDTFHNDRHPDLKADYVLANPPFNDSDWRGELLKTTSAGSTGCRPRETPTLPGCSTSSITCRRADWQGSSWLTGRCPRTNRGKGRSGRQSSKPIWWTAWSHCRGSSSTRRRSRYASGLSPVTRRTAISATGVGRRCSSMHESSALWPTASTGS